MRGFVVHMQLDFVGLVASWKRAHFDLDDLGAGVQKLEGMPLAHEHEIPRAEHHMAQPLPVLRVEPDPQPPPLADEDLVPCRRRGRGVVDVIVRPHVRAGIPVEQDDLKRQFVGGEMGLGLPLSLGADHLIGLRQVRLLLRRLHERREAGVI